jgi:hypothetical protein
MSAKVDWHRAAELGQELGQESLADGGRMSRTLHRLSAVKVAAAKKPGFIADGGNLYLRIAPGGSRQWMFRYAIAGKTRDAGLGPYPTVSLFKARREAEKCRRLVAEGIDPISARNEERLAAQVVSTDGMTFEACAKALIASHEASWRNLKHRAQWSSTLATYAYPHWQPASRGNRYRTGHEGVGANLER